MMDKSAFNQGLLEFLQASPTPFHATATLARALGAAGFEALDERQPWRLRAGGRYYVTRNDSSLIAFTLPEEAALISGGLRILGAHTDSPALKIKPQPERVQNGYFQLGVEVYGGALLNPWFDRDLSIAGRVSYLDGDGRLQQALVDFARPLAVIPSLAIHLDREANNQRAINPQQHLPLLLSLHGEEADKPDFRRLLVEQLAGQGTEAREVRLGYPFAGPPGRRQRADRVSGSADDPPLPTARDVPVPPQLRR